jgi:hypothetical protein
MKATGWPPIYRQGIHGYKARLARLVELGPMDSSQAPLDGGPPGVEIRI